MNSLPSEILHNIFIDIPFRQRLECLLVCHHWCRSLLTSSLLYDVDIQSDESFNKFISMLQLFPGRGFQVEILNLIIRTTFDKRKLLNILPNLRVFKFIDPRFTGKGQDYCSQPFKLASPNSKLEIIGDGGECELTRQLLMLGSCPRLTSLELTLNKMDNPREEVFIYLKGAPVLKKLILYFCKVGIEDLEMIHINIPALEDLELKELTLVSGQLPPHDIIPATSIRTLEISIDETKEYLDPSNWYNYLGKKYTHLTHFDWHDRKIFDLDPRKRMRIYRDGLFSIYKNMEIPLPFFYVENTPIDLNPFATLDAFGLRVSAFNLIDNGTRPIFEQLARSNQSEYTESIELTYTAIASPIMLHQFTSLISLHIDVRHPRWDANLTDYFNALPATLTTFHAFFHDAQINTLPTHTNNIKTLFLGCVTLYPKLGEAISTCFPKLNHISLQGGVVEDIRLDLPDNHFDHLSLKIDKDAPHGFAITNASWSEPQYYIEKDVRDNCLNATEEELRDRIVIRLGYSTATFLICDDLYIHSSRN